MAYLHPGVYVEEVPSGSKPIEGVGTSTAAFIGFTAKGPMDKPRLITKWDDYETEFGGVRDLDKESQGDPMGLSVSAFFQNGGGKAYIVRIAVGALKAEGYVDHPEQIGAKALKFTAVNEGTWANDIVINLENNPVPDDDGGRNYDVYVNRETTDDTGKVKTTELESFLSVSLNPDKALYIGNIINKHSDVVVVEMVDDVTELDVYSDQYLGVSQSGDLGGVSTDLTSLSEAERQIQIGLDSDEPSDRKTITLDATDFASLNELAEHIQEKVRALASGDSDRAFVEFTCVVEEDKLVMTSGSRKSNAYVNLDSSQGLAGRLKLGVDTASDYTGYSRSGDLSGFAPLNLTDTNVFPDDESLSITGTIDGAEFTYVMNRVNGFDINEARNQINTIEGISCTVENTNFLLLTSESNNSSSAVVINSEVGLAPALKLGTTPQDLFGAQEVTGQQSHETKLLVASATSGDLDDAAAAVASEALVNSGLLADRRLHVTANGVEHAVELTDPATMIPPGDATVYDTVDKFLAELQSRFQAIGGTLADITISKIAGVGANMHRLRLVSSTNTVDASIFIRPTDPLAIALNLGVRPNDAEAIRGVEITAAQNRDANYRLVQWGQESADINVPKDRLDGGQDGGDPGQTEYEGVFTQFIKFRDINIVCLPGQNWSADGKGQSVAIIQAAIAHAEKMKNRMVIVDPPREEIENATAINQMSLPSQTYAVVYYPWVEVANRFYHAERNPGKPKTVMVPPAGYAAGMWAKTDGKRGVWKAPAGMETGLLAAVGLEHKVEDDEQDFLNPWGINCFRTMPGAGRVIWGARTRATKADPEWRYVPVRRTAIMIEQSIYEGIQWAVFEPNDHRLWSSLRANIGNFMNGLFRAGAFQGEKASDAYFVRCALGDTMTQGDIDAGQVIVIVGFAPLKPAEFVIVRIQQIVNLEQA